MSIFENIIGKELTRASLLNVLIRVAALPLGLIVTIMLTRMLSVNDFGAYSFLFGLITIISIPIQSSLSTLNIRHIAINGDAGNYGKIRGLAVYSFIVTTVFLCLAFIITQLVEMSSHIEFDYFFSNLNLIFIISFLIISIGYIGSVLRGFHHAVLGVLPEQVIRPLFYILFIAVVWAFNEERFSKVTALYVMSYSLLISVVVSFYFLYKNLPRECIGFQIKIDFLSWNSTIITLLLLSAVQVFNTNIPILTLGILSSNEDVAVFKVASQFATLSGLGIIAVNFVIGPKIAEEYARKNMKNIQSYLTTGSFTILSITFPIALFFIIFGSHTLTLLFGEAYAAGSKELAILCFAQIINALGGSVGIALNMMGKEKDTFSGMVVAAFVNGVCCYLFIPEYGATGAAYASLISFTVWNSILCLKLYYKTGLLTIPLPGKFR